MKSFPSLCRISEGERESMPPAMRYAALLGCPRKLLYLTEESYQTESSYKIHPFKDVQVRHLDGRAETIEAPKQLASCLPLVEALFKSAEGSSVTVINGYPALSETYLLFWHLVSNFAHIKFSNPIKHRDVGLNFIGNFKLENDTYYCPGVGTIAFGPALDEMNDYHVSCYVDIMLRYDDLHKIILTSTPDITKLLERLRLVPKEITNLFNLSEKLDVPNKRKRKTTEVI